MVCYKINLSEIGSLEDINATVKESKKSMKQLIKKNVQASQAVDDATLKVTQLRILQFIGSFGQFIHLEEQGHSGLSKDTRFLCHQIPFQDCKPEIFIGIHWSKGFLHYTNRTFSL